MTTLPPRSFTLTDAPASPRQPTACTSQTQSSLPAVHDRPAPLGFFGRELKLQGAPNGQLRRPVGLLAARNALASKGRAGHLRTHSFCLLPAALLAARLPCGTIVNTALHPRRLTGRAAPQSSSLHPPAPRPATRHAHGRAHSSSRRAAAHGSITHPRPAPSRPA
jgi:hypothetical protein